MHPGSTVTMISFWLGTLLPLVYFPVFLTGIDSMSRFSLFLALIAVNILALIIGHNYQNSPIRE
ncbi:hypothetical protein C482_19269 [Natrialba chahannaoensis JCM 10990]|uniref:Uncharacterized protein n=1 Tax=Natrialba chahannaoensis JCM 10990 TaxID=1227492 RepID=M0A4C0_9EURY|nr:hypothetical protein [Natrialba chahannaoensis]ELY93570.1 hypothetical protein C482_19269 [Natrialba chahannaoensis JCM 10990]